MPQKGSEDTLPRIRHTELRGARHTTALTSNSKIAHTYQSPPHLILSLEKWYGQKLS